MLPEFNSSPTERTSRSSLMEVRKWSVRKLRRRPRSCDNSWKKRDKSKNNKAILENESDSVKENGIKSAEGCVSHMEKGENLLLFGSDLEKQPLNEAIDLSSDQESTGGEDEDILGEINISIRLIDYQFYFSIQEQFL